MKPIAVAVLATLLTSRATQAGNHALYTQLRQAHRAEFYARQDAAMVQRQREKSEAILLRKAERATQTVELQKAKRMEPIARPGVPEAQMRQLAAQFRADHGVVGAPRKAKR
jgi:hypothetical protein